MRVLLAHNYYRQAGGEDVVFANETALLKSHGEEVWQFTRDNKSIDGSSLLALAANTVWSRSVYRELRKQIRHWRPDVLHFHNTLPIISPSAYSAARRENIPVVQTLHNYRLICPAGTCFRQGRPCEDCRGAYFPWPAVVHACYRDSRTASGTVAAMLSTHRLLKTWSRDVDVYVALTAFAKEKLSGGGLPEHRIVVKPNFVPDIGSEHEPEATRNGALFVGRLSPEKGIRTVIRAWSSLDVPLRLVGHGPLLESVRRAAGSAIVCVGALPHPAVGGEMSRAAFLIMPSEWYEGFPMVLAEAFCRGLPVIASRIGAMAEIVEDGMTGLHFTPGDPADLAAKVRWASAHPVEMRQMGANARRVYEEKYTSEANYHQLMAIYRQAIECRRR